MCESGAIYLFSNAVMTEHFKSIEMENIWKRKKNTSKSWTTVYRKYKVE